MDLLHKSINFSFSVTGFRHSLGKLVRPSGRVAQHVFSDVDLTQAMQQLAECYGKKNVCVIN